MKRHGFIDTPNEKWLCGTGIETTDHFLIDCPLINEQRETLVSTIDPITSEVLVWDSAISSIPSNLQGVFFIAQHFRSMKIGT